MVQHLRRGIALSVIGVLVIFLALLSGCKPSGSAGPTFTVETVTVDGLDVGGEDVYLVFTNPSPTSIAPAAPSVHTSTAHATDSFDTGFMPHLSEAIVSNVQDARVWQSADTQSLRIDSSTGYSRIAAPTAGISAAYSPPAESVGTVRTFSSGSDLDNETISATCRHITDIPAEGRTLAIYVADTAWHVDGTDANLIDGDMVTALAEKFLVAGPDNDIWDWTTDIFGAPWGDHIYSNVLEDGAQEYITILLYDIEGDGSTDGGIVGYYDPNDCRTDLPTSDRRLIFALDSVLYAEDGADDAWSESDVWPQRIFSTLAHEFQHMIHYYQKQIYRRASQSDTWLNEMCSLVAEDLLAAKIGVPGPRGRTPSDSGTAGAPDDCESTRLSGYNLRVHNSLTNWPPFDSPMSPSPYYASTYAFGAYVARNYGGANLFRNIVQNPYANERALTQAIFDMNGGLSVEFATLLVDWAVATFTSDVVAVDDTYNRGASVPSNGDSYAYSLGSINLDNYENQVRTSSDPPTFRTIGGPIPFSIIGDGWNTDGLGYSAPASNTVILVGTGLSDTYSWTVEVPIGMTVTWFTK